MTRIRVLGLGRGPHGRLHGGVRDPDPLANRKPVRDADDESHFEAQYVADELAHRGSDDERAHRVPDESADRLPASGRDEVPHHVSNVSDQGADSVSERRANSSAHGTDKRAIHLADKGAVRVSDDVLGGKPALLHVPGPGDGNGDRL